MKNLLLLLFVTSLLFSCKSADEHRGDIKKLRETKKELTAEISNLQSDFREAQQMLSELSMKKQELEVEFYSYEKGEAPLYILDLEMKQSHITLDIGKHIKDEMNAVTFSLPVDKVIYNSVKRGDNLVDEFREGSLFTEGSLGSWKIKVTGKHIEYRN